ncbi:MAG: YlqD family protein [Ignavibacteriales bacterium]
MSGVVEPGGPGKVIITRPVQVRARVTDHLKKQLAADVQEALKKVELEVQQLDFQMKRVAEMEKGGAPQAPVLKAHLEGERQKRLERKSGLLENLKEIANLELGSEVVQGTVEGLAQVEVGVRWDRITQASILLENGVVVEIRT